MKKLSRWVLFLALPMLVIGMVLMGTGWAMGAETSLTVNFGPYPIAVGFGGYAPGEKGELKTDGEMHLAPFQSLEVDVGLGDITVAPGEDYGVDLSWRGKNFDLHYSNENGRLKVWSTSVPGIGIIGTGVDVWKEGFVTVYIPEGVTLKEVVVNTDLGDTSLTGLHADGLTLNADLGDVWLDQCSFQRANLTADLGNLDLEDVSADDLTAVLSLGNMAALGLTVNRTMSIDNDLGNVEVEGAFRGETDIDASLGNIRLTTSLQKAEYTYEMEVDLGDLEIDGTRQKHTANYEGGPNRLGIYADLGDIEVWFGS